MPKAKLPAAVEIEAAAAEAFMEATTGVNEFHTGKPTGYWCFITTFACPLCGRSRTYRERRFDKKPQRYEDRHLLVDDACVSHFL